MLRRIFDPLHPPTARTTAPRSCLPACPPRHPESARRRCWPALPPRFGTHVHLVRSPSTASSLLISTIFIVAAAKAAESLSAPAAGVRRRSAAGRLLGEDRKSVV